MQICIVLMTGKLCGGRIRFEFVQTFHICADDLWFLEIQPFFENINKPTDFYYYHDCVVEFVIKYCIYLQWKLHQIDLASWESLIFFAPHLTLTSQMVPVQPPVGLPWSQTANVFPQWRFVGPMTDTLVQESPFKVHKAPQTTPPNLNLIPLTPTLL